MNFYNEHDAYPAAWLRNLIEAGHIEPGTVDERSVTDLEPSDLAGFEQAHFFAGIGVWSYALRLAGWSGPVWTGSCPCQPFSGAGKRKGTDDDRHLWPAWFRLIRECRPAVVFGEQVAGPAGLAWLDLVHADLEGCGYAVGAAVIPAAGVGAPHGRHRIYFVAHADAAGRSLERSRGLSANGHAPLGHVADGRGEYGIGALLPEFARLEGHAGHVRDGRGPGWLDPHQARSLAAAGATRGFWRDSDWWLGIDGKARPIGPGLFPLADGAPARMGRLRAYGNALVAQQAAAFVSAAMDCTAPLLNREGE